MSTASKLLIVLALLLAAPSLAAVDARCVAGCGGDIVVLKWNINDGAITSGECIEGEGQFTAASCSGTVIRTRAIVSHEFNYYPLMFEGTTTSQLISVGEVCKVTLQISPNDSNVYTKYASSTEITTGVGNDLELEHSYKGQDISSQPMLEGGGKVVPIVEDITGGSCTGLQAVVLTATYRRVSK